MLSQRSRLIGGVVRTLSTSNKLDSNHYDVLGITPKANQSDIKSAYYELSKIYHPDKAGGEESAKKFRLIAEAYEVLGNIHLKKMYDKGLLTHRDTSSRTDYQPEEEPLDPKLRFYKSRIHRSVTPTMDGRVPIYNFDEWSRNHYGDLFEKAQYEKETLRKKRAKATDNVQAKQQELLLFFVVTIGALFIALVINGTTEYDSVQTKYKSKSES